MDPPKTITGIVIINYKSSDQTISFIREQLTRLSSSYALAIVDTGCTIESHHIFADNVKSLQSENTFLLHHPENIGYASANNLGAQFLIKHCPELDSLLFSNVDIELPESDVIEKMHQALVSQPDTGAVDPHVEGHLGRQGPAWTRKSIAYETIMRLFYPLTMPFLRLQFQKDRQKTSGYCYSAIGCFLMVSRQAFEMCGGFDPATFLYSEEDILAERLLKFGLHFYLAGDCRIIHYEGGITRKFISEHQSNEMRLKSQLYYYRTYHHASWIALGTFKIAIKTFKITEPLCHQLRMLLAELIHRIFNLCQSG